MARRRATKGSGGGAEDAPRGEVVLRGHARPVGRMAWSPDGRRLATPSLDGTLRVWDAATGEEERALLRKKRPLFCCAWSPDGARIAAGGADGAVRVLDAATGEVLESLAHEGSVYAVAWSPDGKALVTASKDGFAREFRASDWTIARAEGTAGVPARALVWAPHFDGFFFGNDDGGLHYSDPRNTGLVIPTVHDGWLSGLAVAAGTRRLISVGKDGLVVETDLEAFESTDRVAELSRPVRSVSASHDGRWIVVKAKGEPPRVIDARTWSTSHLLPSREAGPEGARDTWFTGPVCHPARPLVATLEEGDRTVRIRAIAPEGAAVSASEAPEEPRYRNAKVVLLGDSGSGKSGLALVLAGRPFAATFSTHAREVRVLADERVETPDGPERRETLLWDLAGQADVRLLHQLHVDDVTVALLVFDAERETTSFASVRHWARALKQAERARGEGAPRVVKLLVAARADVARPRASPAHLDGLVEELSLDGRHETSAKEGWGVEELRQRLRAAIDWERLPRVTSSALLERLRAIAAARRARGSLFASIEELAREAEAEATAAEVAGCLERLESRDVVRRLGQGGLVLLAPEVLDAFAAAIVQEARSDPSGLGAILEARALHGDLRRPQEARCDDAGHDRALLAEAVERLLRREVAFREPSDDGVWLVFPSQLTREREDLPDPPGKAATIAFEGPVASVYATLVVRLAHGDVFGPLELWRNAAAFGEPGRRSGLFLRERQGGQGEVALFHEPGAPAAARAGFERYVLRHVERRALPGSVSVRRAVACARCATAYTDAQVEAARAWTKKAIPCVCGASIPLAPEGAPPPAEAAPAEARAIERIDQAADAARDREAAVATAPAAAGTEQFRRWAGGGDDAVLAIAFTDIVDSTRMNEELGDVEMDEVRALHFARGTALIRERKGQLIKTIGDAIMAAFHSAHDALAFALELWRDTGHAGVSIRAGIHVGPVRVKAADVFGGAVNYASRIEHPQKAPVVVLSDEARRHILETGGTKRRASPAQGGFVELERRTLKGFEERGPQRLWMVAETGSTRRAEVGPKA